MYVSVLSNLKAYNGSKNVLGFLQELDLITGLNTALYSACKQPKTTVINYIGLTFFFSRKLCRI